MAKFLYSFVSRGPIILCEYSAPGVPFQSVPAGTILSVCDTAKNHVNRSTYPQGQQTQHFLVDGELVFMVLADTSVSREWATGYLERLKADFLKKYKSKAMTAKPRELSKQYAFRFQDLMAQAEGKPAEFSKAQQAVNKIQETRVTMQKNVEQVLARGEKLENLQEKADTLAGNADMFKKKATEVKTNEWYKNMKVKILVLGFFIALGIILFFSLCGGLRCVGQ